jgi:hypothetical protein
VLLMAKYFSTDEPPRGILPARLWVPFRVGPTVVLLTLIQPDLGTAIILGVVFISMVLMGGLRLRSFAYLVAAGWHFCRSLGSFLKNYQRNRILTFLDPDRDPARRRLSCHPIADRHRVGKIFRQRVSCTGRRIGSIFTPSSIPILSSRCFLKVGIWSAARFTAALLCLDRLLYPLGATG